MRAVQVSSDIHLLRLFHSPASTRFSDSPQLLLSSHSSFAVVASLRHDFEGSCQEHRHSWRTPQFQHSQAVNPSANLEQAGGNSGSQITNALLEKGIFTITALTRSGSRTELPAGIHHIKHIDYANPSSLVSALHGQDVLIITLSGTTPKDTQMALVDAAIDAVVRFIMPNEWSPDTANEGLCQDVPMFGEKDAVREYIAEKGEGRTAYIAMSTGFWYEWMLAMPAAYGFDFEKNTVTFFDDGETVINHSTLPRVGRAVAALLSLPQESLSQYANKQVYISSFAASQKDMFASVLRATGTKEEDWQVSYEPAKERHERGLEAMKGGDRMGLARAMATRVFFKDDCGWFEKTKGTLNGLLGLPVEDLDEATRAAIERARGMGAGR